MNPSRGKIGRRSFIQASLTAAAGVAVAGKEKTVSLIQTVLGGCSGGGDWFCAAA